jgi:hypothetical protein
MKLSQLTTYKVSLGIFIATNLIACGDSVPKEPYPYTELAMEPGMHIEATNKNGTVSIDYIDPLKRRFRWEDHDEVRTLIPRKERWLGELGAYDPAPAYIWEVFTPRIVATDSQLHFDSMSDIDKWLYQSSPVLDWVYTDDGLVVGFSKNPNRYQVNVAVYQLYLNGKKPTNLEGSRPENIKTKRRPRKSSNLSGAENAPSS